MRQDLTGRIFGRLTVISKTVKKHHGSFIWICRCECGTEKEIPTGYLTSGDTRSCGCLFGDLMTTLHVTHGDSVGERTPEYNTWKRIKGRCLNPNNEKFPIYGGRGIKVCSRWLNSFENFLADMGRRPNGKNSIERVDVNGHYEPSNCKWGTAKEQANNTRYNRNITHLGVTLTVSQWAEKYGIKPNTIIGRLRNGWSGIDAITTPVRQ